jgi:invasion protein IalB
MKHRDVVATTIGFALACMAMTAAVTLSSQSMAQQPTPKAAAPKAQQKTAPPPAQPQQAEPPNLTFAPWTKLCPKGPEAGAKAICLTGRDGTLETGMPVVTVVLIEPEGETKKVLRVTLPLGVALPPGSRVVIDQGQPMNAPYMFCAGNGCTADYEASGELVANMKKGKSLAVQGINGSGQPITLLVPLADFAKAHEGPPTDPKVFEEQQRKRFEEFRKKSQ